MAILGAVLVVIGAWIGGKHHPAGWVLALIPIGIWAGLHAHHWLRNRKKSS